MSKVHAAPEGGQCGTSLVQIYEMLKSQLDLEGNMPDVFSRACVMLGVSAEGPILDQAARCRAALLGGGSRPRPAPEDVAEEALVLHVEGRVLHVEAPVLPAVTKVAGVAAPQHEEMAREATARGDSNVVARPKVQAHAEAQSLLDPKAVPLENFIGSKIVIVRRGEPGTIHFDIPEELRAAGDREYHFKLTSGSVGIAYEGPISTHYLGFGDNQRRMPGTIKLVAAEAATPMRVVRRRYIGLAGEEPPIVFEPNGAAMHHGNGLMLIGSKTADASYAFDWRQWTFNEDGTISLTKKPELVIGHELPRDDKQSSPDFAGKMSTTALEGGWCKVEFCTCLPCILTGVQWKSYNNKALGPDVIETTSRTCSLLCLPFSLFPNPYRERRVRVPMTNTFMHDTNTRDVLLYDSSCFNGKWCANDCFHYCTFRLSPRC